RDAAGDELVLHLVGRDAVAVDVTRDPLAVRDEVGDDRGVGRRAPAPRDQGRYRGGGRRVRGHDRVGPERLEERGEPPGAEARDAQGERGVARHPISERVADTPEQGRPTEHRALARASCASTSSRSARRRPWGSSAARAARRRPSPPTWRARPTATGWWRRPASAGEGSTSSTTTSASSRARTSWKRKRTSGTA